MEVRDHLIAVTKAACPFLPYVGSVLGSLLSDYMPTAKAQRLEAFLRDLGRRLERVEATLSEAEFGFLLERALRVAASDHRNWKRLLLAAILTDAATTKEPQVSRTRLFIDFVEALEPYHVTILRRLRNTIIGTDVHHDGAKQRVVKFHELANALSVDGLEEESGSDVTHHVLSELAGRGLLRSVEPSGKQIVGINPVGLWRRASYALSPLGRQFCDYVEAEIADGDMDEET